MSKSDVIRIFRAFDLDGSGTIEEHELLSILQAIGGDAALNNDEVSQLLSAFDLNKDGRVQMEEFVNFVFEDLALSCMDLPPRLKTAMKVALDRLADASYTSPEDSDFESKVQLESAGIKELRSHYKLDDIPDWLETKIVSLHLKTTPISSGDHKLKLTRLAPHSESGSDCVLCLLDDTGSHGVDHFLYSLQDEKLSKLDAGIELMNEADCKLPRELKLWCCLCVGADGRDKCMFSKAISVLTNSGLLSSAEVSGLAGAIRSQKDFMTLTEFILQVNMEFGVDESDPEVKKLLKRAAEEPKEVIGELSMGFGVDVSAFVTEPELEIDWIISQLRLLD